MTATLSGLPPEILDLIVNNVEEDASPFSSRTTERQRKRLYGRLRQTCREINNKICRPYGKRYFKHLAIRLNEKGLSELRTIAQGQLGVHVEVIMIDARTILRKEEFELYDQSSDFTYSEWYPENSRYTVSSYQKKFSFDEAVLAFLLNGKCGELLGQAMSNTPRLRELYVRQPEIQPSMREDKICQLKKRWSVAVRTILTVTLANTSSLKTLVLGSDWYGPVIPVDIAIIDQMALYMTKVTALTTLHFNIATGDDKATLPEPSWFLENLLHPPSSISDLDLGFGNVPFSPNAANTSYALFKHIACNVPFTNIRRLALSQLSTREKYIAMVLRSCRSTLQALSLHAVTIEPYGITTFRDFFEMLCKETDLEELSLRALNHRDCPIYFDQVNERRPAIADHPSWQMSDFEKYVQVTFLRADGDFYRFWLDLAREGPFGQPWAWDSRY